MASNSVENDPKEFYWTGHPFVDVGLSAILLIANKENPRDLTEEDIKKSIDFASKIYSTNSWSNDLHGQVFPNSGVLMANPSMKKNRTPENISANLRKIYHEISEKVEGTNVCITCGKRERLKNLNIVGGREIVGRHVVPLIGTGDMLNFFHSANNKGIDICAGCLFLIQFLPIASYKIGRILAIHAYPPKYSLELNRDAVNHAKQSRLFSSGKGFRRPVNFLFHKIREISRNLDYKWTDASVTAYYFTNFSQRQYLSVIYFPSPILEFIAYAVNVDPNGWNNIIRRGWIDKNSDFEELEKQRENEVYRRLVNEESILKYFYDPINKEVNADWRLLEFYLRKVINMDEDVIEFIKEVSDRIIETIENEEDNKLKKTIRELERSEKLYQFENFFLRVEKLRQNYGVPNALLTFDEFAKLLTGYGEDVQVSWRVVKDLILFRIYEKLHNRLIKVKDEEDVESVLEVEE